MRAFSMDLRERIVAACASGETAASVAQRFGVCSRTVQRYVERAKRDALVPTPIPGRPPRLAREDEAAFLALVEESPNRTLLQLQEEWHKRGVAQAKRCVSAVVDFARPSQAPGRALQEKSRIASERCAVKRQAYQEQLARVPAQKLVFLDQCGFSLALHRLYGWVVGGGRCIERVPLHLQRGKAHSVVGALSLPTRDCPSGLRALWQKSGTWTRDAFEAFLQDGLLPVLAPGSVLVLDNARIHHGGNIAALVEAAGCSLLYLPPYSPDFNPIEMLWSWLKSHVRTLAPRDDAQRWSAIQETADALPQHFAAHWFEHVRLKLPEML